MNRAAVGIFDSGLGGLTVVRSVVARLPHDDILYVGDTARVPYGPKSPRTVRRYSHEILAWLLARGVKAVVVACNTSTAHALESLQEASSVPVLGVVDPGARAAAHATRTGRIGVIGTVGTIGSGAYERAIRGYRPDAVIQQRACPLFVPLAEEGWFDHPATELVAREYLAPWLTGGIDTLVLGCTHYPLLKPLLGRILGPDIALIDSAEETAISLASLLADRGLEGPSDGVPVHQFAVTDEVARFREVGARFVGAPLASVDLVALTDTE